ncbi:MAG: 3'-5' exonuclease, partial [Acidobacteriota bacterium]
LNLAREIVPEIEPRPGAPEGVLDDIKAGKLIEQISNGDLVVCRLTAPLINLCIRLIAHRIPARVRGRDIGKQLTSIIRDIASADGFEWEKFGEFLEDYRLFRLKRLRQGEGGESQIESFNDRIGGIKVCYQSFRVNSVEQFNSEIEALFSDEKAGPVLSTVHRAKGLEENRVFILNPEKMPLCWPKQQDWEAKQELNLKYVALTRAKEALYFVQ